MVPEFLDFDLRISRDAAGAFAVTVRSPAGEASGTMHLTVEDLGLRLRLEEMRRARDAAGPVRTVSEPQRQLTVGRASGVKVRDTTRDLGRGLFEALLPPEVATCYRSSLGTARAGGKGLRIRLRLDAPELALLPWEFLYDEAEREHTCLDRGTPIVRHMEMARASHPLTIRPPLRILGMIASPVDLPDLDVGREKRHMEEAIRHLRDEGRVSVQWLAGQTARDLQKAMIGGPWNVFHFIGHGNFDGAEGQVALADEQGRSRLLSATQLGQLLAGHDSLRLVVLNSCEGARASATDLFSSTGAVLTRRGIPAVVSMQDAITDRAALEFSRMFYDAIAGGLPVDAALTEARIAISTTMGDTFEWGTPVLYMRSSDGRLFDIDAAAAVFLGSSEPPPAAPQPIMTPVAAQPPIPSIAPISAEPESMTSVVSPRRGLSALRQSVKKFWVEGVLENSLSHSRLIDVDKDTLPEMVDSPYGSTRLDPKQPIASLCDELGGSFLILGVPGVGKTTIMLSLARELICRAEQDPGERMPVVFNLTSWAGRGQPLSDWLLGELATKYLVPKGAGRSWLEQGCLRLFLDGLDEVPARRRAACVEAINTFLRAGSLVSIVVCCRFNEYTELPIRLMLNGALRLRTLSRAQIGEHLDRAGSRLQGLRSLLERDSSLQVLAQTPFMLSLMIRTYGDLPPGAGQRLLRQRRGAEGPTDAGLRRAADPGRLPGRERWLIRPEATPRPTRKRGPRPGWPGWRGACRSTGRRCSCSNNSRRPGYRPPSNAGSTSS